MMDGNYIISGTFQSLWTFIFYSSTLFACEPHFPLISHADPSSVTQFVDERPAVLITVHGVGQIGNEPATWGMFPAWAKRTLGKTEIVPFDWSEGDAVGPPQASIRIGHRADQIEGQPNKGWQGASKLKELVGRLRKQFGSSLRIGVLAYSQGTVMTLSALQEGAPVDYVVFMGSPLFGSVIADAREGCDLAEAMKHVTGKFINIHSESDDVVGTVLGALRPATSGVGIGARGFLDPIKDIGASSGPIRSRQWQDGRLCDLRLMEIEHYGQDGWWSSPWREAERWPTEFPSSKLAYYLGSDVEIHEPMQHFRDFAVSSEFHNRCQQGFGDDGDRSEAEWTFHLTKEMVQGFHVDDKDVVEYELEVQAGAVDFDILHATFYEWENGYGFDGPVVKAGSLEAGTFRSKNWFSDATFWLRVKAIEDKTELRLKVVAKDD